MELFGGVVGFVWGFFSTLGSILSCSVSRSKVYDLVPYGAKKHRRSPGLPCQAQRRWM